MTTVGPPGNVVVNARAMGSTRMREQPDFGVYPCSRRCRRRVARDADAAVSWVKQEYPKARFITPGQRHWLAGVTAGLRAR